MLPTSPKSGTLVLFQPPPQAYSLSSQQHRHAGRSGVIYRVDNDSFAWVLFGRDLVLVNTAYLYEPPCADGDADKRRRGRGPVGV